MGQVPRPAPLSRYFDSVVQQVWGFHHPLAISLRLVKKDTLFDSAEPVLRLMLDVTGEAGSANSEVCSLKDSLANLLTRQGKFLSAIDVCLTISPVKVIGMNMYY
jgi:hypothetical protein